jgi:hypothetical protein
MHIVNNYGLYNVNYKTIFVVNFYMNCKYYELKSEIIARQTKREANLIKKIERQKELEKARIESIKNSVPIWIKETRKILRKLNIKAKINSFTDSIRFENLNLMKKDDRFLLLHKNYTIEFTADTTAEIIERVVRYNNATKWHTTQVKTEFKYGFLRKESDIKIQPKSPFLIKN